MTQLSKRILLASAFAALACAAVPTESDRLAAIIEEEWAFRLEENPLMATSVGLHDYDDRLPGVTEEDHRRRYEHRAEMLERLAEIDRSALGEQDLINVEMLERQLTESNLEFEFGHHLIPFNSDSGFHSGFARLHTRMPFATVHDYENYIARLEAFGDYVDQHIVHLEAGLERGMTLPRVVLDGIEGTMVSHVVEKAEDSVLFPPFTHFPVSVPKSDHQRLTAAGKAAILEAVVPAYRRLADFVVNTYRPGARETLGASQLPNGEAYYAHRVKHFTTLDSSPQEIHDIGLAEVARIRGEMETVIEEVGFEGSFAEFLDFLRTDERFYPKTPLELLKEASFIAKRMDAELPSFFGTLPRLPYGVEPVPDHIAPKYTAGRYVGPAWGSTEPGLYWVNLYAIETRPLYNLEALTLHEAVPGHHLQNALARELEGVPPFRRFSGISAYGEGWALYSERLGLEAGFYTDPYSNFGRLTYEMWRACRLVVDTGLHAFGWSRQQAMDYLAENTALPLHEIATETDRYISWPAQALSYKMGELEIRALRREAQERLGERFDIRDFHDVILADGPVPLSVLRRLVESWIAERETA